jgi:hypothetical protein
LRVCGSSEMRAILPSPTDGMEGVWPVWTDCWFPPGRYA